MPQVYILVAIGTLAVIAAFMIFTKRIRPASKLSPLTGLSLAFIINGIVFSENRLVGYSLIGIGILFAVIEIVRKKVVPRL